MRRDGISSEALHNVATARQFVVSRKYRCLPTLQLMDTKATIVFCFREKKGQEGNRAGKQCVR